MAKTKKGCGRYNIRVNTGSKSERVGKLLLGKIPSENRVYTRFYYPGKNRIILIFYLKILPGKKLPDTVSSIFSCLDRI